MLARCRRYMCEEEGRGRLITGQIRHPKALRSDGVDGDEMMMMMSSVYSSTMTTVSGAYVSIACIFLYMHVCMCVISPSCGDEEGDGGLGRRGRGEWMGGRE